MAARTDIDVLVVGLGPAGAEAARAAADQGLRVLAIERNARPGEPVQCAEFVPMMIGMDMPDLGDSLIQPIGEMQSFLPGEAVETTADFRGRMVDRARFDRHLIARAQAAGAECRFASPLQALAPDGTAQLQSGARIRARAVIGADGPRSRVGAAIGAVNADLVESRQITVALNAPHAATDIYLHPDIVGGYAWLFPKGDQANLGLGVAAAEKARLKPLLDGLHAQLVAEGRIGAAPLRHTGGAIPVGGITGPVGRLGDTAVFLAGDAAGLVNPVTGAGIPAAVLSGRMAGLAAAAHASGDADALADYAEEIDDTFGASLSHALARRRALLATYRTGSQPGPDDLRRGWIAFPQYWTRDASPAREMEALPAS
ncbi:NAD(P)/FAD-dependent oxidoreductase [Mesobacterium sp. TK19101]|uniref:NAD(P)/FAD-dependent oxidoreductase n=1 Tax=Mesobacterium hydrothermale TaxID=3111907 RepID=A0ABU6HCG3_9RHOB|nr:NAD(P)/FAD-dependent oxidoreductase [Mesobacterium sp. TK19101]MEC3860162.1 NAD(P)/FAD-dependent oxidoreductase [Mesobacterium sp. TK19101]